MPSEKLRERLVWGAGDVFYAEGINATGVQRISEALGISKKTMYELFESKDDLVAASLAVRDEQMLADFTSAAENAGADPIDQLVGLFVAIEPMLVAENPRGCPFLNACAELADAEHPAHRIAAEHKEKLRKWIERRVRSARMPQPKAVSVRLMLILDGAMSQAPAGTYRPGSAAAAARAILGD